MKCPKCHFDNPDDIIYCGKCAAPLKEEISASFTKTLETQVEELTPGSTFAGRYQIIEELGKGGMGSVYRVQDKKLNEEIALKLIKPKIASDKKTIERFSNELKIARKIVHKSIGRMFDLNEEKGTHYITMEYVPGQDLKGLIRQSRQLTVGTTISIAHQVCEGLAEAHRMGVVHRDLKPSNIMIDKEGNARIMDFGIARSLKAKGITGAGVMIGTPEYMSPEQVEGKEVDRRSDIYSLGVVLYEMVTGRVPFEGDTPFTLGVKHKSEIPKDPQELNTQIPEDLSRLILRCMEKDREKRYQSPEELLSELTNIEKGIPTTERIVPIKKPRTERIGGIGWKKIVLYGGIAALVILLIVAGFSLFTGRQEAIDSIAVLPLENQSGDPGQEYFADGMTDALITELSKIGALRVISRTSVMRYKGTEKLLPEIARELGVDVLVEGSVLHAEDKVRIMVQLIQATPEKHLWADDYERDLRNVIAMQKEIAQAIAREIKITVRPEEQARLIQSRPINPEAYQLYLKGRFFWNKRTEDGLKKAIDYFKETIGLDPNYALGYIGLADSYLMLDAYTEPMLKEAYLKAREAVLKALEIDSNLAEAHTSLAWIKMEYDWDWEGAEREFKRAIELNPGYATAHRWYSRYLMYMARFDEAMEEIKHALELDPLSLVNNTAVGNVLYYARQYDQAIESLQNTMEMDPNFSHTHVILGRVYLQKSMYEEALTEFQKGKELSGGFPSLSNCWIGLTYVQMGKRSEAQDVLDNLIERKKRQGDIRIIIASFFYFALGRHDQGFEALEKDIKERIFSPWRLKIGPEYDSVRSDPRFIALLKELGLE